VNSSSIKHVQDDFVFQIGKHGRGKAEFMNPQAICATHNRIYISDSNNQKIDVFTLSGEYKSSFDTNAGVKIMHIQYKIIKGKSYRKLFLLHNIFVENSEDGLFKTLTFVTKPNIEYENPSNNYFLTAFVCV